MRPNPIIQIFTIILCCLPLPSSAAIGIFNWSMRTTASKPPATIQYRLNCPGTVHIHILDDSNNAVHTLGPYTEASGLHSHSWDGTGINSQSHSYRARITATAQETGTPGTLKRLAGEPNIGFIYGVAVDKCPTSPGYGTIYVSRTQYGGAIRAFYPDGTPKNDFGPDPNTNLLNLGFEAASDLAPWGIGVDDLGNIYTACRARGQATGIKVFDYLGNQLYHVFPAELQGNLWLAGLARGSSLEVYETIGSTVRYADLASPAWTEAVTFPPGLAAKQLDFEPGGNAFYVATSGYSGSLTNIGVWRFIRQENGAWQRESSFDPGLSGIIVNGQSAAWYTFGASCDALDPDGDGPCTCSRLWMGLNITTNYFGGNIIRKNLPTGSLDLFSGPGKVSRIVAADAVGNVVLEYDVTDSGNIWSNWGIYAPAGELSTDTRTTGPVTFTGSQSVIEVHSIAMLRNLPDAVVVELMAPKIVTAVYSGRFYMVDADRSGGIRVDSSIPVSEGAEIKLRGVLATREGERTLIDTEIVP